MRNKSGATLVELLIVGGIVAIFGIAILSSIYGVHLRYSGEQGRRAQVQAEAYVQHLGYNLDNTGIECASVDSDGDGLVSCTVVDLTEGAPKNPLFIECYWRWEGCRGMKPQTNIYQQ